MLMKPLLIIIFSFFLLFLGSANAQSVDSLLQLAQQYEENWEEVNALETYNKILDQDSDYFRALWKASLMYSREGRRLDDEDKQKEYFNSGKDLAEKAIEVAPDSADGYYVMGVAMGRMALISGAKARVAASRAIKENAEKALEIDPNHAGAWHLLGRWHQKVANLSFVERIAANTLFGGIPKASEEEAEEAFLKAIDNDPDFILYHRDLANLYYHDMEKENKALEHAQKALELSESQLDDARYKEEMQELVKKIK